MTIRKVAVIGSGVMGSGIAAQVANAGIPVVLLDIVPKQEARSAEGATGIKRIDDRSALAKNAVAKMLKADPAPFMSPKNAKLITPGNMEDDLGLLSDCDWIVEVVLEDLKIKHATYEKIQKHRKPGSIVSSNTSTIPLHHLVGPFGEALARDFLVTHFFNPPRYMRLMELVVGDKTRPDAIKAIEQFCDVQLGKGVVRCNDTPGFIANRLGVFWMQCGLNEAINLNVGIETADAIMSKPVGIPKTGIFALIDLVGVDLMPHLAESMLSTLPDNDWYRKIYTDYPFVHQMIAAGYTGRKGKGGFFRLDPNSKKKDKQALQLGLASKVMSDQVSVAEALRKVDDLEKKKIPICGSEGFMRKYDGFVPLMDEILDLSNIYVQNPSKTWEATRKYIREADKRLNHDENFLIEIVYDLALDTELLETLYRKADKPKLASMDAGKKGLRAVMETDDEGGRYAWAVLSKTLAYAASLVPEIADDIASVDEAMRLGYNWKRGPFEMIDEMGAAWFAEKLKAEGIAVPPLLQKVGANSFYRIDGGKLHYFGTDGKYHAVVRPEGVLLLRDIKLAAKPVIKTASAAVWDIGDGVLCVEFTGKMNTMDNEVFDAYAKASKLIDGKTYKAMVIYNEGSAFSAGANLGLAMFAMNIALWPQIEELIGGGQRAYMALKYAPFPVVAAPSGLALGGGCEILLHADHVQAHAETYTGLVEVGVGLIPGWGGCKEMILRFMAKEQDNYDKATDGKKLWFSPKNTPMGAVRKAFETIGTAQVAKSAQEAKEMGYFRDGDGITMNRDRLLYDAKMKALALAKDYKPPEKVKEIKLPGASGKYALDLAVADLRKNGKATPYDVPVSSALAAVLTGGEKADWTRPVSEDDILKLEISEFMKLVRNEGTMARIEHMLETGKPLRN